MEAYDGIALSYFYLGSIKKAKHYHDRALRGKSENEHSVIRQAAIQIIMDNRDYSLQELRNLKADDSKGFDRIPSPSSFCVGEANHQINLLPHFTEAQAFEIENQMKNRMRKIISPNRQLFKRPELRYLNYVPPHIEKSVNVVWKGSK